MGAFTLRGGGGDFEGIDTALALLALSRAKARSPEQIKRTQEFLFKRQNTTANSPWEGGLGVGQLPIGAAEDFHYETLESTSMAIQAWRASGVPVSDPHIQRALGFISRCQDLSTEQNHLPWVTNTGRGVFSPPQDDRETRLEAPLHVYDSFTWTSMLVADYLLCEVPPTDPRLVQALGWLKENTTSKDGRMTALTATQKDEGDDAGLYFCGSAMGHMSELLDQGVQVTTLTLAENGADIPRFNRCARLLCFAVDAAFAGTMPDGKTFFAWMNGNSTGEERFPQIATIYMLKTLKSIYRPSWPE